MTSKNFNFILVNPRGIFKTGDKGILSKI